MKHFVFPIFSCVNVKSILTFLWNIYGINNLYTEEISLFALGLVVPSSGYHVLARIKVIPSWWNRPHISAEISKLPVFVHCSFELLDKTALDNLAVRKLSVHVVSNTSSTLNLTKGLLPSIAGLGARRGPSSNDARHLDDTISSPNSV